MELSELQAYLVRIDKRTDEIDKRLKRLEHMIVAFLRMM